MDKIEPPPPNVPAPPPPPVERAIQLCVMTDLGFENIGAVYRPETGDTLAIVGNERAAVGDAYGDAPTARGAEWFENEEPLRIDGREYLRFGLSRIVSPGELVRRGEYNGIPLFVQGGEPNPANVLYVPVTFGCEVQPYQAAAQIRVRG